MKRRGFIASLSTVTGITIAGCNSLGGDEGGEDNSGGESISASLDAESEDFTDHISETMEASAGDDVVITVEAGESGAQIGFLPEEDSTSSSGGGPDDIGWGWGVDANEELTETIEIEEDETYVFWITQGSADVEARID